MKLAVMIPYYKLMFTKPHYCIVKLIQELNRKGIDFELFGVDQTYIHDARTSLAKKMMESHKRKKFDWCMHIDSDQVFSTKQVLDLIQRAEENNFPILSGIYFTTAAHFTAPLVLFEHKKEGKA